MSTYIVPGTKLTTLDSLATLTDNDLFYVVDTGTDTSKKTTYMDLTGNIFRDNQSLFLRITGGTLMGSLSLSTGKGLSSDNFYTSTTSAFHIPYNRNSFLYLDDSPTDGNKAASRTYVNAAVAAANGITYDFLFSYFVAKTGASVSGNLSSVVPPTDFRHYTNAQYVTANYMPFTGGTFTGPISVPQPSVGDPINKVATVGYVENRIAAQPGSRLNTLSAFIVNGGLNKHNNNGRGNSGLYTTFIKDNDQKIRSCGYYGNNNAGGYGFYDGFYNTFPVTPIEFINNDGTEYIEGIYTTNLTTILISNFGNLYGAGTNNSGQLGLGDTKRRNTFVSIICGMTPAGTTVANITGLAISQGNEYLPTTKMSVYALSAGRIWSWGSNTAGQLGAGTVKDIATPVPLYLLTYPGPTATKYMTKVVASNSDTRGYALALDTEGVVYGCGWNGCGQLGLSAAIKGSGATTATGVVPANVTTFTNSVSWILSGSYVVPQKFSVIPLISRTGITANEIYTAGSNSYILTGQNIYSCGNNVKGACGNGTFGGAKEGGFVYPGNIVPFWTRVLQSNGNPLTGVDYITTSGDPAAGGNVSVCAVLTSGLAMVWGSNASGQLGTGDVQNKTGAMYPLNCPGGIQKAKMVGQTDFTTLFILDSAGDIYVSGYVNGGLDGRGEGNIKVQNNLQKVIRPQGIKFKNFEVFSYGNLGSLKTVLAQTMTNELYTWGFNNFSQAGVINLPNTKSIIDIPIKVSLF